MAKNKIQDGNVIRLAVGSGVKSGDPVAVGTALHGVALKDYSSADGKAEVAMNGVFDLSVQAVDGSGNSAVAVGDQLYLSESTSPYITKKTTGKYFGVALEAIASGSTATINVLIGGVAIS